MSTTSGEKHQQNEHTKRDDLKGLTETLQRNGYPKAFIEQRPRTNGHPSRPTESPVTTVCLPYNRGLAEKIRRICGKSGPPSEEALPSADN